MTPFIHCEQAGLKDVLAARELRAVRQKELLSSRQQPVISFSLNIAGPYKAFPLALHTFNTGDSLLRAALSEYRLSPDEYLPSAGVSGYEALYSVAGDPMVLKRLAVSIEEAHPLGRLFDFDILDKNGRKISRDELGLPRRTCLICGGPAFLCSRSRAHSVDELQGRTLSIMNSFFCDRAASSIALDAHRALLYELSTTPKPGLVDRQNNGSHNDMDFFTFIDSSCALIPYFYHAAKLGAEHPGEIEYAFADLRRLGTHAERDMLLSTGGVNTHKGSVFSFGILCCAAGYDYAHSGTEFDASRFLDLCSRLSRVALNNHNLSDANASPRTHGDAVRQRYGIQGVRKEAASGFSSATAFALPTLLDAQKNGDSKNDASVRALMSLICRVEDTNIISRSDLDTLHCIQSALKSDLDADISTADLLSLSEHWDQVFIEKNISPGGCADLLGVAWLLLFLANHGYCGDGILRFQAN